jgi:hypothetical protein
MADQISLNICKIFPTIPQKYDRLEKTPEGTRVEEKKRSVIHKTIRLAIVYYDLAATAPALNYAKRIEPCFRDDVFQVSRSYMLRRSIDVKYALQWTLEHSPKGRAANLYRFVQEPNSYWIGDLDENSQFYLDIDIYRLVNAIKGNRIRAGR